MDHLNISFSQLLCFFLDEILGVYFIRKFDLLSSTLKSIVRILRYEILDIYLFTQFYSKETDMMVVVGFLPQQVATLLYWMIGVVTLVEIILMCMYI